MLPRDYAPPPLELLCRLHAAAEARCRPGLTGDYPLPWWGQVADRLGAACEEAAELEFGFVAGRAEVANENLRTLLIQKNESDFDLVIAVGPGQPGHSFSA